jgi:ubiquinone/menaquinone biosynthesis C-methylase UbiE
MPLASIPQGTLIVTLKRVLEPEVMDTFEEAMDYNEMDHREVNERFVSDLLACGPIAGEVLDIGTGTGLIPIELCRRNEDVRVMAIDMSWHMLDQGRINIELEGLTDRIMFDLVDAKDLFYDDGRFSVVMSNGILHHIAEPSVVLREAIRVTAPGGLIFCRDLMRPEDETTVKHLVETYAGQENEHQQKMFEDSLHAALNLGEIRGIVQQLGGEPAKVEATSDRHWTWSQRKETAQ